MVQSQTKLSDNLSAYVDADICSSFDNDYRLLRKPLAALHTVLARSDDNSFMVSDGQKATRRIKNTENKKR